MKYLEDTGMRRLIAEMLKEYRKNPKENNTIE